jgi:ABC-type microcin C transport system permease subunit YejB
VAFWFLWGVDALTALIAFYFFFVGLADGTVSSFNIGIWTVLLLGLGSVVLGSLALRAAGRDAWARALVVALAVPAFGVGLFFAVLLVTHPRWN